jgi:SAM-dependent methyltransferase
MELPPMTNEVDLPYYRLLHDAGEAGQVLHRQNIYGSGPPSDAVHTELLQYIERAAGKKLLEIGCGLGPYVEELNKLGFEAIGIELEEHIVAAAQAKGRPVSVGDATNLQFEDKSFDTCMLIEVVEHIEDYETALLEAGRVARRSLIVSVPNSESIPYLFQHMVVPWHLLEATHINFFTPAILGALLRRLFPGRPVRVEGYSPFFPHTGDKQMYYQVRATVDLNALVNNDRRRP